VKDGLGEVVITSVVGLVTAEIDTLLQMEEGRENSWFLLESQDETWTQQDMVPALREP
jgi:hypothetical protein